MQPLKAHWIVLGQIELRFAIESAARPGPRIWLRGRRVAFALSVGLRVPRDKLPSPHPHEVVVETCHPVDVLAEIKRAGESGGPMSTRFAHV